MTVDERSLGGNGLNYFRQVLAGNCKTRVEGNTGADRLVHLCSVHPRKDM